MIVGKFLPCVATVAAAAVLSAAAKPVKSGEMWKEFTYDAPDTTPIVYGGESRAEDVHASDYCIYLDIYHSDGSTTWAERVEFTPGTHGWEKRCGAIVPKKPVKKIKMFALCRKGDRLGKAEFRDFFLERREGKGDVLHEMRRSLRPFADADVVIYETFDGRKRTLKKETVPAVDGFGRSPLAAGSSAVWVASSMRRVSPLCFPEKHDLATAPRVDFDVASRGSASAQVLVSTAADVEWTDATLRVSRLTDRSGREFNGSVGWQRVGYLPRETFIMAHPYSPDPRENWIPDPLLPAAPFCVRKGSTQALWITAAAAAEAVPGVYFGEIEVVERGKVRGKVSVSVRVRDFSLPETFGLDTSFALMDGFLRRTYPASWKAMRRQAQDVLLDHRLNPDDITRTSPPDVDDLIHARSRGMSGFTILNIVPEPKNPNHLWTCFAQPDEVFCESFYPAFRARLAPYYEKLKKHGLDKYARLYGFDERDSEYYAGMMDLWKKIKSDFPSLPVITSAYLYKDAAAKWKEYQAGKTDLEEFLSADIFCPTTSAWSQQLTDFLRGRGRKVFWYTCCGPRWPYANFASYENPVIEARLVMGFQTHLFNADGFLFWHVNNWKAGGNAPFELSDTFISGWSTRNSLRCPGDGVFLYPAKDRVLPSIRLALLRDGVQDYEWLRMAESKCGRKAVDAVSRRLVRSLTDFTRDPAAVRDAHGEIGDMIDGGAASHSVGAVLHGETDKPRAIDYKPGETMTFTLSLRGAGRLERGKYFIDWSRTGDDGRKEGGRVPASADEPLVVKTKLDKPGFVRVKAVVVDEKGVPYRKKFVGDANTPEGRKALNRFERMDKRVFFDGGAGVDVDKLRSVPEPADFDEFWARRRARLAKVPLKAETREVVSKWPAMKVYEVSIACAGPRPSTGYLTKPKKPGKYPIVVDFHGYGHTYPNKGYVVAPTYWGENVICFHCSPHGYELGREPEYYDEFFRSICSGGKTFCFDEKQNADPETSYFSGYTYRIMRAIEWLRTLPEWNGTSLRVNGGSMGGLQSVWAAGLAEGVTLCTPTVPWCCDMGGRDTLGRLIDPWYIHETPALRYYDPVNIAKRIPKTCQVEILRAGLGDYCCPPSGVAVLYNNIHGPKKINWVQGSTHGYVPPEEHQHFSVEGNGWSASFSCQR